MDFVFVMQNVFDFKQNTNFVKNLPVLSGLYQFYFSVCGHGLYSDRSRAAEDLTVCKMCDMQIFYALMSPVKDTTDR